ncbi:MAG: hypothetical protein ACYC6A_04725, partial [Armatimonadota bacterium]
MPSTRLSLIVRLIFLLIPVVIIGLSVLLFVSEARHSQIIEDELHAIRTLQRIDQATILLDRQRLRVAQSIYLPFDRTTIRTRAAEFHALFADPTVFPRAESRALRQQILT